ncbi:MAG TPA: universal stress protein [Polyangia bacterium]
MSILVGVDLSPGSINAARSAAVLARFRRQPLVLVRVVQPVLSLYPELIAAGGLDLDGEVRAGALASLENLRKTLLDLAPGIEIEARVETGAAHEALLACAKQKAAEIIVLGSKARGPLGRLLLGSVAQRIIRDAPCAVLVCPEGKAPFTEWAAGKRPLKVVAGVDRSPASEAAIALLGRLRTAGACDITLVHEYWPPGEYARLGLRGPRDPAGADEEVVASLNRELRELWAELPPLASAGTVTTRVRAGWSTPGLELALDAEAAAADLLVIGTTQAHGMQRLRSGSDAISAVQNCHVPVLVVPAKTRPVRPAAAPVPLPRAVLVTTDFSEFADAAIPHAYGLVRSPGTRVELCHVHEPAIPLPAYVLPGQGDLTSTARKALEAQLSDRIPSAADEMGIETHVTVIDGGAVAEQILQAAHRLGVDAIVMSSHGRGGVGGALFGSVTQAVLHKSDLPVYVVRPAR